LTLQTSVLNTTKLTHATTALLQHFAINALACSSHGDKTCMHVQMVVPGHVTPVFFAALPARQRELTSDLVQDLMTGTRSLFIMQ
jgi:hypothetical protein